MPVTTVSNTLDALSMELKVLTYVQVCVWVEKTSNYFRTHT